MRNWVLRGGVILLGVMILGTLFWAFSGSSHDPNHDINMEQARAAANRVHPPPKVEALTPDERAKIEQNHGG